MFVRFSYHLPPSVNRKYRCQHVTSGNDDRNGNGNQNVLRSGLAFSFLSRKLYSAMTKFLKWGLPEKHLSHENLEQTTF